MSKKKEVQKPIKHSIEFYDWYEIENYLRNKYRKESGKPHIVDDLRNEVLAECHDGEYRIVSEGYYDELSDAVRILLEEFGNGGESGEGDGREVIIHYYW